MLKIKEILSKFQEDTKFIEKVANSNTIDKLYEVFCEYEYDSDINSFESEIYELLSSSDLIKKSIDEEELEKISGGANMRKKIMSVIALSSLAIGGVTSKSHVDAGNVTAKAQRRNCGDTFLPIKEWETLGIGLLTTILGLGGVGYIYHRHKNSQSNDQNQRSTGKAEFHGNQEQQNSFDSPTFEGERELNRDYSFEGENGFQQALGCIATWHKDTHDAIKKFPENIVKAVEEVEKTFFPTAKPTPKRTSQWNETSLKTFPKSISDCQDNQNAYFVPLSWNNGNGSFDENDFYMLQKVLFQYLCRMLCFVLNSDTTDNWKKDFNYISYLEGTAPINDLDKTPDYTNLFKCMMEKHGVRETYRSVKSQVALLIQTLADMYQKADLSAGRVAKCGVFCGNFARSIDN